MLKDKFARAYMIYDSKESKWYGVNALGFVSWVDQQEGAIWTSKEETKKLLDRMRGARAKRCEIKTFLLLPANN